MKVLVFFQILLVLILVSGARLVSSDEVSMYLTVERMVQHARLDIPSGSPSTSEFNGKAYTWYEAGNIISGIPLYLAGYGAAQILPLTPSIAALLPRASVSLTSAFIGGLIGLLFYSLCRAFGIRMHYSVLMTMALVFGTCMLPYFKTFFREPLQALCLLGGFLSLVEGKRLANRRRYLILAGIYTGYGILTKLVFMINILPLALYLLVDVDVKRTRRERSSDLFYFVLVAVLIGGCGEGLYNYLRFGNPLMLGYTGGTAFPTPLLTGMYGLLLSAGKGLLWFAPILVLLFWAVRPFWISRKPEAVCILGVFLLNLVLYSLYIAWGGDGSWGPRYLMPVIPLLLLPVAVFLANAPRAVRSVGILLIALGVVVQVGGVAVYPGAYLQETREFPYQRSFADPEFLYKAHFIPDFSPIPGQWKMAVRNAGEHLRGEYPRLSVDTAQEGKRLPVSEADREKLVHTLDFWFTYALYAGIPFTPVIVLVGVVALLCVLVASLLFRTLRLQPDGTRAEGHAA